MMMMMIIIIIISAAMDWLGTGGRVLQRLLLGVGCALLPANIVKVLEHVGLLVGRVVSDVLLNGLDLLNEVKLVLLGQLIEIQLDLLLVHSVTLSSSSGSCSCYSRLI